MPPCWPTGRALLPEYLSNPVGEHAGAGQNCSPLQPTGVHGATAGRVSALCRARRRMRSVYSGDRLCRHAPAHGVLCYLGGRLLCWGSASAASAGFPATAADRCHCDHGPDDWGPIYFATTGAGWHEGNTLYPFYRASPDTGFVAACDALLADRLKTMQWWEEDRSEDGFFSVPGYQAPSVYHAADGRAVAMFKHSHTAISEDEGRSWSPVRREPSLVMSGAKVWGQRTSDGRTHSCITPAHTASTAGRWRSSLAMISIPTMGCFA